MKKLCYLLLIVGLDCVLSGCSKKDGQLLKGSGYKTYSIVQKPFSFQYPSGMRNISHYSPKDKSEDDPGTSIDLSIDLHWDPWNEKQKEPEGDLDAVADWSLYINFYDDTKGLEEEYRKHLFLYERVEEVMINNIPMLRLTDTYNSEKSPNQYVPLIPGEYMSMIFYLTIEPPDSLFQQRANRLNEEITRSFTWKKPIDTSSQEFKDWKAHILSLLKEAKNK